MAEVGTIEIPASAAVGKLTLGVKVTGLSRQRLRSWFGVRLMKLAAWVIGCQCEISFDGCEAGAFKPSLALPPLRLSVNDVTRGVVDWAEATRIKVMLDGVEVRDVLAYDGAAGWVERNTRDDRGDLVIDGADLVTERVHGTVTVEWRA